jgi:hypothetical protein
MARPKAMSDNTLYGLIMIVNAVLFTVLLIMKLIDGNVFLGGVTLGTTVGSAMIGYKSKSGKTADSEIEDLRQQIEELKNKS